MSIKNPEELKGMRASGKVVRLMLEAMKFAARSGITTGELDAIGADVMRAHRARSAPALIYGFPGVSCISVNDEIDAWISRGHAVCAMAGDLLKLDVTVEKDGFMADAAESIVHGLRSGDRPAFIRLRAAGL